jgi:hypothetical protein
VLFAGNGVCIKLVPPSRGFQQLRRSPRRQPIDWEATQQCEESRYERIKPRSRDAHHGSNTGTAQLPMITRSPAAQSFDTACKLRFDVERTVAPRAAPFETLIEQCLALRVAVCSGVGVSIRTVPSDRR